MEWIPQYISNKHGRTKPKYLHPKLEPILRETYGDRRATKSRSCRSRATSPASRWAKPTSCARSWARSRRRRFPIYREKFVDGAIANGIDRAAGRGDLRVRRAVCGLRLQQVARGGVRLDRLPDGVSEGELSAAVLRRADDLGQRQDRQARRVHRRGEEDRHRRAAARRQRVAASTLRWSAIADSLRAWPRSRASAKARCAAIIEARERGRHASPTSSTSPSASMPSRSTGAVFEALIKCGALDALPGNRAQLLAALDAALELRRVPARDRELGQASLFGDARGTTPSARRRSCAICRRRRRARCSRGRRRRSASSSRVIRSPTLPKRWRAAARRRSKTCASEPTTSWLRVAGMLTSVRRTLTKAQQQMLIATLEDMSGSVECIVFPKIYAQLQAAFLPDAIVIVKGRVRFRERRGTRSRRRGARRTVAHRERGEAVRAAPRSAAATGWHVTAVAAEADRCARRAVTESPGAVPVVLHIGEHAERLSGGISNSMYVRHELERIFGGPACAKARLRPRKLPSETSRRRARLASARAARKRDIEAMLRGVFGRWSYAEVQTPGFERFDVLGIGLGDGWRRRRSRSTTAAGRSWRCGRK